MPDKQQQNQTTYTHFGFEKIKWEDKAARVSQVFSSVAGKYDLMNDAMSLGSHRLWKRTFVSLARLQPGAKVLDLASGSGDIALSLAKLYPHYGELIVSDLNPDMLQLAKQNLRNHGIIERIEFKELNAEELPFPDNYFNCITISFGLRNVTDKPRALKSSYAKLASGGQLLILEFSKPTQQLLSRLYDQYSFRVIPSLGKLLAQDAPSYQYLVESIRQHPDQEALCELLRVAGFSNCHYYNLLGGIVAMHKGVKL